MLKAYFKIWNREVFENFNQEGDESQKKIQDLDARDDENELDDVGREERRLLLAQQSQSFFKQEAILYQKAYQKWLKQNDLNSKFFIQQLSGEERETGLMVMQN